MSNEINLRPHSIHLNSVRLLAQKNRNAIMESIDKVIKRGVFLNGRENQRLEKRLSKYLGGYVLTTASGHDALLLSLLSLRLKTGDEIIFPVNSYPSAFPVFQSGAKPVPVDVNENGQLSIEELKRKITRRTKVVVTVHLYGLVNIKALKKTLGGRKIYIVVDAAQAFGSMYNGRAAGTLGDVGCFSFYPTKNLGTLGDGGAIWTKHKSIYDFIKKARQYGEEKRFWSRFVSSHSRLPEIQAAVLNLYLTNFISEVKKKNKAYSYYREKLKGLEFEGKVRMLESAPNSKPLIHLFTVEVKARDKLRSYLKKKGIETDVRYPFPVHLIPAFKNLGYKKGDFPIAERLSKNILSLPFHSFLTEEEINYVVSSIKEFYAKSS